MTSIIYMPLIHLIMTRTLMKMVITMPTILDMKMASIVDMTVVITEGIVMVGLMMIFGLIGTQSVGGDCM
jgi:hypothetical protein